MPGIFGVAVRGLGMLGKKLAKRQKTTGKEVISSVKPSVPKTKVEKARSKFAIAKQKTKGSQAKLNQTIFNLQEQNRKFKGRK